MDTLPVELVWEIRDHLYTSLLLLYRPCPQEYDEELEYHIQEYGKDISPVTWKMNPLVIPRDYYLWEKKFGLDRRRSFYLRRQEVWLHSLTYDPAEILKETRFCDFADYGVDLLFNIPDWIEVLTQESYVDNDGAGLWLCVAPSNPHYGKLIRWGSTDEADWRPLDCTYSQMIEELKNYTPSDEDIDWSPGGVYVPYYSDMKSVGQLQADYAVYSGYFCDDLLKKYEIRIPH